MSKKSDSAMKKWREKYNTKTNQTKTTKKTTSKSTKTTTKKNTSVTDAARNAGEIAGRTAAAVLAPSKNNKKTTTKTTQKTTSKSTSKNTQKTTSKTTKTTAQPKTTTPNVNFPSAINLGLGPISRQKAASLIQSGDVKVDNNGSLRWAEQAPPKTTIKSDIPEKERKARISQIDVELGECSRALSGISRAKAYGTNNALNTQEQSIKKRMSELDAEKKKLERVGTFTASEMKQFEIDDAKVKKNAIPDYSGARRLSPTDADAFQKSIADRAKIDKAINLLERDKAHYKKLERNEELNEETAKIVANKDFQQNSKYSPTKPKTAEQLKKEGYRQDSEGAWYKLTLGGRSTYAGEDDDVYTYINDESQRSTIDNNYRINYKATPHKDNGYHLLTEDERGAYNYLYHQDKLNGTKTAEEYLKKISPMLQERVMAEDAKYFKQIAKESPVTSSVFSLGTNLANAAMFPTKIAATLSGTYDDMPSLDKFGNRTTAIRGGVSEDMGDWGKMFYNAGMSIGDMGVAMLAGGGNATAIQAIMSSSAGSSTISEAKRNGASDGKALVLGLGSAAIEWATEKYSVEAILKQPKSLLGFVATNTFTEATEEGASNISNIALDAIVSEVFGERNELEQRIDYLVIYEGKSEEEALQIAVNEKLQSLGEDVLVGGLTGLGMSGTKATTIAAHNAYKNAQTQRDVLDTYTKDTKSLKALIDSGKSSGEGTNSYKIAQEVQKAQKDGTLSKSQVKQLIKATDKQIKAESKAQAADKTTTLDLSRLDGGKSDSVFDRLPLRERLELVSKGNNVETTDIKKATGFGDEGVSLVSSLMTNKGMNLDQAYGAVKTAYSVGFTNVEKKKVNFETPLQEQAFDAGKKDKVMADAEDKANAKNATVYEGNFSEKYRENFTDDEFEMISKVVSDFGMEGSVVDEIIASEITDPVTGEVTKFRAAGTHEDGKLTISATTQKVIYKLVMHETGHRMKQLAPTEFGDLMSALYQRSMRRNSDLGIDATTNLDIVKAEHDRAGIEMTTGGYLEEFAVRELEDIFGSAEAFNKWVTEIESDTKTKSAWDRFTTWLKEVFEDIKMRLSGMSKEERAKVKNEYAELDRIMGLLEGTYKGAKNAATELKAKQNDTNSSNNLEIKTNEEYNGNESYSLYDSEVIFSSRYNELTQSQAMQAMYDSAKKGNLKSAYNLISQFLGEEDINKVKDFGDDVYLLPVVGAEGTSTNLLPKAIAEYISGETGQTVFYGIYKQTITNSRGKRIWERMKENHPSFMRDESENINTGDINGKRFVLIDDNATTGRTFVGLRNFIEENGGEVVGYYALTTGQDQSEMLITTNETWNKLLDLGLDEVKAFAERKGIKREISQRGLTERETQELIKRFKRTVDNPGRGYKDVEGSGRVRETIQRVYDAEKKDGSNQEINYSLEGEDHNKLSTEEKKAVDALGEGAKAVTDKNGKMLIATDKSKGTVMYSLETYNNGGKEALEKALRANGHTEAEIKETLSWVDDAGDYLTILAAGYAKSHNYTALSNHLIADVITNVKTGKQVISAIVNNGDYPVNIDLALICKKRVAYMNLMNRLIDDGIFDKVNYGGEAIAKVNDLLRADGFETACLGCFVESRRLQFQTWAETIVSEWNAEVDKRTQNAGSFSFADGKAKLTDTEMDALAEELKNAGKKNAQGNLNLGQGSVQTRMGRLLDKVPSLQKHLTVADLLKPEGLTALRAYDSNLFSLVKSRYGAASPKIVQDYNPYASEIAMMTFSSVKNITSNAIKGADAYRRKVINEMGGRPTKQKGETTKEFNARKAEFNAKVEDEAMRRYLYDIGGARIQSFSDFMIENVFDYIQIFADLSAKRLPLHGYTKEIVALRLFGMTGAKWNGSLIAHVDRTMGKEYAGLLPASEAKDGSAILVHTKDGDYAIGFDDYARYKATNKKTFIQSIGMKDIVALQLDPRYSSYVGSITIGVSDKQILAMLDSPLFRFVIPYHSSGMLPQFAKLVGVDLYNDYTDYQNTTVNKWYDASGKPCNPIKDGKGDTLKVDTSYNFNAEVQNTGDAKKAADNYLKWCAEKHPVYDGKKRVGYVTFTPKFANSPYGTDFSKHENYYKLLEDFNVYDNITEESAVQGAVTMNFPSEQNRLSATEMEAYKERLRETGIFSEKEIEKYSAIADKTFKELIAEEVKGRADYQNAQAPKWEGTIKNVENMLLKDHKREGKMNSLEGGLSNKEASELVAKYAKGETITTEKYNELVQKYGAIHPGENPHRDVEVPRKTGKGKKVSQTVRTVLEAEVTPDTALPTIEKMVEDGVFSYDVYTDKQAIQDAQDMLKGYGWVSTYTDWMNDVKDGIVSKQHTVQGWAIYNNAVNRAAEATTEDAKKEAMEVALNTLDMLVRHQRNAAQALQATRVLKKLSPETQLYGIQKSVNAFQKELIDKYGKKAPNLKIDEELAEKFLGAETQEERDIAMKEIYKDIGRKMTSRFVDKWNAWRYLAMLGNPRTHVRNIFGNLFFAPVVAVKDLPATIIESIVAPAVRLSGKEMLRSKSLVWGSKNDIALLMAAWRDYANVADAISNGGKYNDFAVANQQIEEGRKVFKSKVLAPVEWLRKANSKALEVEDVWFSMPHYAYALAQYCKANNITAEQIAKGKAIAPAREYAIKEAQKATYKDTNGFSQMVSEWGRNSNEKNAAKKAFNTVVEGILPFRKTPANILVRGVEYSPLGLLKGLTRDLYKVAKGEMYAHEAIDNISAGLTGTGLVALGVWLAAEGLVRGHGEDDEEERKFKEMQGHQSYALELPNGTSITLDWLAPEALPFFVGVNLWEATKGSDEETNLASILNAIKNISEPMLEMSCLQGLNDLIEGVGNASSNETSGLVAILSSAVTSYLTQGIPTLAGQAERTSEEERMTTYIDKNGFLTGDIQYTFGKASAKIPGWDYSQIPFIDAWGRREASGTALKRGLSNFLNPAYTSEIESSDVEEELLYLYNFKGETSVFPQRADKYFMVDGVRKDLTAEEYIKYATLKGEKSYELVSDLIHSDAYKNLDVGEKIRAIEDVYDYANQKAKEAISNYDPDTWVKKADGFNSGVESYITFKTEVNSTKKENGDYISKQDVVDIILNSTQNDADMWNMYFTMYGSNNDAYAYDNGIEGETYMQFIKTLNKYDEPNNAGKYGTYTQDEVENAINSMEGLSREEKAILYQSANTTWKRNPFR